MKDVAAPEPAAVEAAVESFRATHPDIAVAEVFVVDLNGVLRGKLVPVEMLGKLARGAMKLPISTLALDIFSIDVPETGLAIERGDPDGTLLAIPETVAPVLWADRPTMQVQCMLSDETDRSVSEYDPRGILARVAARAAAMGYRPVIALELEFFLIDPERPEPPMNPQAGGRLSRSQIYDMDVMRAFEPVLSDIAAAARALGAPAETVICEFGPGQFEMNLAHCDSALMACDHMIALKRATRGIARRHGLDASFMAKPFGESAGSGQHIHLSLLDGEGQNVFGTAEEGGPNALLRHAVAGVLDTLGDCFLLHAPHLNSYRRFMPGSYAPVTAAWGLDNRSVAVRVPAHDGPAARLEARIAGADANPYLLAASVLAGALAGLEATAEPPAPVAAEALAGAGGALPLSWAMAEQRFAASPFVAEWLGEGFVHTFAAMKRQERATLMAQVPDIEYDAYLRIV
ncbi:MAG: glutamine synthetase family protein [Pseudomonadota bacterium]